MHCRYPSNQGTVLPAAQPNTSDKIVTGSPVIDVAQYSTYALYLLADGNIIKQVNESQDTRTRVSNNVKLTQIATFNGYLYGVSAGSLYTLDAATFDQSKWIWKPVDWAPIQILELSPTYDGNYMWFNTREGGMLFDASHRVVSTVKDARVKRYYGKDSKSYIEVRMGDNKAMIYPSKKTVLGIRGGILTHDDQLVRIPDTDKTISHYRLLQWKPYVVRYQ